MMLPNIQKQSGAVLAISLIMLLLMTIIGVTSISTTSLEERMAGNSRDRHVAFEAAEVALIEAEDFLETVANTAAFLSNNAGLYEDLDTKIWQNIDWGGDGSGADGYRTAGNIGTGENLGSSPKYVIQFLGGFGGGLIDVGDVAGGGADGNYGSASSTNVSDTGLFRITARGTGGSNNTVIILQTVYAISI